MIKSPVSMPLSKRIKLSLISIGFKPGILRNPWINIIGISVYYDINSAFLFSKIIPGYEQILMGEYTNGTDEHLVFLNPN